MNMDALKFKKVQKLEQIGELLKAKTITISDFEDLKMKIMQGESFQLPSNRVITFPIKIERITKAGRSAENIFWCIIWQVLAVIVYVFFLVKKYFELNYSSEILYSREWTEYYTICNIGLGIVELIIFCQIMYNLWHLSQHLIKANNSPDI